MAQYALGLMYYKGHGVAQDLFEAYKWCAVSSTRESDLRSDAIAMREDIASHLTATQISDAQKWVRAWRPK